MQERVCIGLGSNLGNKQANLREALQRMGSFAELRLVSSLYRTEPVGFLNQDWFLNAAAIVHTALSPSDLLQALLRVEMQMGRVRTIRNGPRLIDLDLLLWERRVLAEDGLTIPHPRLAERHFVLMPLREVAGDLVHPLLGATVDSLCAALGPARGVERFAAADWPPPLQASSCGSEPRQPER